VIIINWNGRKWLEKCLDSIKNQTYENLEVIFVDNASSDDSVRFVKENYPTIEILENDQNYGFAKGANMGLACSHGDYILLLNTDLEATPNLTENLYDAFEEIPHLGCVQPKLLLMDHPQKLDSCGSFWTSLIWLYHYGNGKDGSLEKYNKAFPVFSNKGAAILIKREATDKLGLFDEDFWCYYEESDFCHRLWLAGYECWYYPKATVYHAVGGTSSLFQNWELQYHSFKNRLHSYSKNFQMRTLVTVLPIFLSQMVLLSLFWLAQGKFKHFQSIYNSIWWNFKNLPLLFKKRNATQLLRQKTDKELFTLLRKNPKFSYFFNLLTARTHEYEDTI